MAILVRVHGQGIDQLQLDEVELRELASNEVRMTVKASRITGDQLNYIKGLRLPGEAIHEISSLGYEAAGIVTAIGKAVDEKWLGKRVMPVGPYDFERYPSLGDDIIVPASRLVEIPDNIDFAAAASTWVPYLTAYPVYSQSNLKSGDYVLIIAGTSAVGQAAIDLARELGAIPIVTTRSRRKAAQLRQLKQLNHVIISNEEDLVTRISEITVGKGVQFIFDPIGGNALPDLLQVASVGAKIYEYGILGGSECQFSAGLLLGKGLMLKGWTVSELVEDDLARSQAVTHICEKLTLGDFNPTIAKTYPLSQIWEAYRKLEKNDFLGTIIIEP